MKTGPKPLPTEILKRRGSRRVALRRNEPEPTQSMPICPTWLSAGAKAVWAQLADELYAAGLLTSIDGQAFARYCQTFSLWQDAAAALHQADAESYPRRARVYIVLSDMLRKLENEFGMSPSARASLTVTPPSTNRNESNGRARFFKD